MSRSLRLTDSAEQDLAELWSYLAEEASEAIATRFLSNLYTTCTKLLAFPLAHPERRQLGSGVRVVFHGAYAIYYRPDGESVSIIRVLHGARDIGALAEHGAFD